MHLRRDSSDGDVAFLLSIAVRDPFVVYANERARLRTLASSSRGTDRAALITGAAEELLQRLEAQR